MTKPRLNRAAWIHAGIDALMDDGPDALKAEPLARRLNTTKGSFYWHFRDVPEFHAALLAEWQAGAVDAATGDTPVIMLRQLAAGLAEAGNAEPAIRAWAKGHKSAAAAIEQVDLARLSQLEILLREVGIANPEMARILYAASLGMQDLPGEASDGPQAMGTLVDLVLALR